MSYKITGTVKFNQFSHEYALDLNVTETQPEQAKPEEPKLFHQEVYDYEETPEALPLYTVEYQGRTSGLWKRSINPGLKNRTFATRASAIEAMEKFGSTKQLTYRVTEVQQ